MVATDPNFWVDKVGNFGALAIIVGLFMWHIWPKMMEHQREDREVFRNALSKNSEAIEKLAEEFSNHDTYMKAAHSTETTALVTAMNAAMNQNREMISLIRSMNEKQEDKHKQ